MKVSLATYDYAGKGALIKLESQEGIGYADCHPWPHLGDLSLDEQLRGLKENKLTPLTARSILHAKIDAQARSRNTSLFKGLTIPKSHYFCNKPSEIIPSFFQSVKIKKPKIEDLKQLPNDAKWRVDFNASLTPFDFENFLKNAPLENIEFIEDPTPFDADLWEKWQRIYPVCLACDRECDKALNLIVAAKVLVVKPALCDPLGFVKTDQKIVITGYLDHPVGQMMAAYFAATLFPETISGVSSHRFYPLNPFSEILTMQKDRLMPPGGSGIGFDALLNSLNWEPLNDRLVIE